MGDEMDFDDLLAEAENEASMYDDYMDDVEAEMAMEAEASAKTPEAGSRWSALGIGLGAAGGVYQEGARGTVMDPLTASRKNCPSPAPLEQRLGVSPVDYEEEPFPGVAPGDEEALKALNNEVLRSPLHPVLKESSNSRWSHRRFAAESKTSTRATGGGFRPLEDEVSSSSRASQPSTRPARFSSLDTVRRVDTQGIVLSRPSIDGDSVPFMQSGGRMMHLRVHRPSQERSSSFPPPLPPPGNLLRTPFATLTERVMERRVIAKSLETAAEERAAAVAEAGLDEEVDDGSSAGVRAWKERGDGRGMAEAGGALWVDKYAPEAFRDLLSDERVNREVLRAVKAWDRFVFKKEPTNKTLTPSTKPGGRTNAMEGEPVDKRPDVRVIMLCGPPGLGKTTLAHVVARHAGYRVYEINASDDRSAPVLKQRLVEAMEGNTLLADKRPNLIILDEVDGADGKAAAQVIVDIATAPLAKAAGAAGGKKGKRKQPLTRPLVLICNDQWTPALRPIRALAQVFVFRSKSSPSRLVQRLKAICSAEGLCVNTDALTRLADRSHLDVRSCLNTLQFVARRAASGGVRNASAALLTAVAEGIKDDRRDLFEVLRSVFTRKKSGTKKRLFVGGDKGSPGHYVTDRGEHDLLEEVEAFNDHGKVVAGVHENFLGVRFNDPTLCKAAAAVDWLAMADLMDARTSRSQDYAFSRYLPLAVAGVHYLCRSDQRAAVTQPKKDYEARMARSAKRNILHSFVDGRQLTATARSTESVVLDMLSHLMDILAPTLRPLNPDLLSSQERARLSGLIGVLLSCGLTFAPRSTSGGGSWVEGGGGVGGGRGGKPSFLADRIGAVAQEFVLEPAIDQLVKYEGYDFAHPILAAPLRPIVAHEVSLEAMRQTEASKASYDEGKTEDAGRSNASRPSAIEERKDRPTDRAPQSGSSAALAGNRNGAGTGNTAAKETPAKLSTETGKGEALQKAQAAAPERRSPVLPFWNRTNRNKGASLKDDSATGAPSASKRGLAGSAQGAGATNRAPDGSDVTGNSSKRPRGNDSNSNKDGGYDGSKKSTVRYQFRAGYTNAVRRPVRMKDLL